MKNSGRSMAAFESQMVASSRRTEHSHHAMTRAIGVGTVGALTLVAAASVKSVQEYKKYNREMQAVKAVSQASAKEMATLDEHTKKIGVTTKFSATQAASASVELVKAGMSIQQVIGGGLTAALSLATAGDLELADAATYTSNAMNMFGIEAKNAGQIADALAKAANDTTADVGDFGMALSQGGSAAKMAGLSFKDTMVILEALAKQGIKNSDAGTSMKTSLLQLLSPTKKQAELQKELGLSFVDNHGKMKNAVQISRELHKATKDMTQAERLATFEKLAGTDGIRTLNALYATGPKLLENYRKGLALSGEAARVAKEKQQGLAGSTDKAEAAMKTMLTIIGEGIAPTVAEAADGFSHFIREAAASGDLKDFGEDLGHAAEEAGELARQFYTLGSSAVNAAQPAVGALQGIAGAMPDGSAVSILGGIAAGFMTLRTAQAAAPGVERMAGSIGKAMEASRKARFAQDIASSFASAGFMAQRTDREFTGLTARTAGLRAGMGSMVGGLGAVASSIGPLGGLAIAAGAGFSLYSFMQQRAAQKSAEAAAAIRESGEAARTAGDQYVDATTKVLQAEQKRIALQELVSQRNAAKKSGDQKAVDSLNNQIKQGRLDAEAADRAAKSAVEGAPKVTAEQLGQTLKGVNERWREYREAISAVAQARVNMQPEKEIAALQREADARHKTYLAAKQQEQQMRAMRQLDSLNQQRTTAKNPSIIRLDQAQGVVALRDALKGMPKSVQTRILVHGSAEVLGQLGQIMAGFRGIPNEKRAKAILSGDGSVKQKLAALKALAIGDKRFNVRATDQASRVIAQIQQQRIADKFFSIFGINRGSKHASGAAAGRAHSALVGEEHPREAVINRRTGQGFVTDGPMLMSLSDDDYVIPFDQRYRGRALGLFAMLARDLGVEGFKKGKKPKGFPVPAKHDRDKKAMSMSLEDLESRESNAKSAYDSHKKKKDAKKYKARYEKIHKQASDARTFANSITKQEDFVEIAENDIALASKNKDAAAYKKALDRRTKALGNLNKWLTKAVKLAPKDSKWERELKKKLGQVQLNEKDIPEFDAGDYLTAEDLANIEKYETLAAQAELTDTLDDDKAALGSLKDIREGIYKRVATAGAPNSVIKDAAEQLKSARDNLANLASSVSPDQQAIADQANERARIAGENQRIAEAALATFTGSGDIGSGGRNAYQAAGGGVTVIQNNQMLTPSDPRVLAGVAGAAAAGISAQGYVPSSRVKTGL